MPPYYAPPSKKELVARHGRGRLERFSGLDYDLPVLHVAGSPAEMGEQYGALLGEPIKRQVGRMLGFFTAEGVPESLAGLILDGCWNHLAPHTRRRHLDEMAAIAQGAQAAGIALSLDEVHRVVAMTNFDLYQREERFVEFIDPGAISYFSEEAKSKITALAKKLSMACTMFAVWGSRTKDGKLLSARNLDWVSQTGMHAERLVTVYKPEGRHAFVTMGYAGVPGCLAGMNEKGLTLSEVGAFSMREELDGEPWGFMARRVMEDAGSLEEAVEVITTAKHTAGYNFLVADGNPAAYGTADYRPGAAAFETNFECCEVFYDNDPKEAEAVYTDREGNPHRYGTPLPEAVLRADTAFGRATRALQATDNGPGAAENTGDPNFDDGAAGRAGRRGSTYTDCHVPMYDMIRAYEAGAEYVFPVRNIRVIEKGEPRQISDEEMLNIAGTVAHNTEKLYKSDWNVMSVGYAPTDLVFYVAFESCNEQGEWKNAPDSGYYAFNLRDLLAE